MSSREQIDPPLIVAEKWSKSAKIIPMGTLTKTRKTRLSIAKPILTKQHYQLGKCQKLAGCLRVKINSMAFPQNVFQTEKGK